MALLTFSEALIEAQAYNRKHVMLGNGFSIACRPQIFAYGKLFEQADFSKISPTTKHAFAALATQDFEKVIKALRDASAITTARTETPLQTCLLEVDQSDIYVGIIAFRLGSIEPNTGKSYTQLEYERAIDRSKEVFIYLVDDENARVAVKHIDRGEARDKLDSFKRILRERHTVDSYTDEADLIAKVKRDLQRHLSPRAPAPTEIDEFLEAKTKLEAFLLLPKSVAGIQVRLRMQATGRPYAASRALCQAFNLEFGATVGVPIKIVEPSGIQHSDVPDLYINGKLAAELLPIKKGDLVDGYVKLDFSSKEIGSVRAHFRPKTEYPKSPYELMGIESVLGEAVHHEADSRLAMELAKSITFTRTAPSAV